MSDPIDIIRAVVRDELRSLRLGELAVVTSVFPHTEIGRASCRERVSSPV